MSPRLSRLRTPAAVLFLLGGAACSKPATPPSDDLTQDLAQVTAHNDLALSPVSTNRTDVVSAVERAPVTTPTPSPSQKVTTFRRSPRATEAAPVPVTAPSPNETVTESHDVPAPSREAPPTVQPRPTARPTPEPSGGWKTPSEIIRDAPFPINP
jgi:hypothetical protein